jgi:hypothetical protein
MPKDNAYYNQIFQDLLTEHTPADQETLKRFKDHLTSVVSATLNGITAVASGEVSPSHSLVVSALSVALSYVPIAGSIMGKILTSVSDEDTKQQAQRINRLLKDNKHKDDITHAFCIQAVVYHGAHILDPKPEQSRMAAAMQPLVDAMQKAISLVLSDKQLPSTQEPILQQLLIQLMQGLTQAVKESTKKKSNDIPLSNYLADKLVVVKNTLLIKSLAFSGAFQDLSVEQRYIVTEQALNLSMLSYADKSLIESRAKHWHYSLEQRQKQFFYSVNNDLRCFTLTNSDTVLCVFRGTIPESIASALTDPNTFLQSVIGLKNIHTALGKVFFDLWNDLNDKHLSFHVNYSQPKRFIFTGHSLGGALALLAGKHFYEKYPAMRAKFSVMTFGQLSVDDHFPEKMHQYVYRFVNAGDPVVRIPFEVDHIGHEYILPDTTEIFDWERGALSDITASQHGLSEYQRRLSGHAHSEIHERDLLTMPRASEEDLEKIIFRPAFKTLTFEKQRELLQAFSTALIQGLCHRGGIGFNANIENAHARIKALVHYYTGLKPQANLTRSEQAQLFFESERLHLLLKLSQYQYDTADPSVNKIFSNLQIYLQSQVHTTLDTPLTIMEILNELKAVFEQSTLLKKDIELAPLVIMSAFAAAEVIPKNIFDDLRYVLYQQPSQSWVIQGALLLLLVRGAKIYNDYWPVLLGETGQIDLSFWLSGHHVVAPSSATELLSEFITLALSELLAITPNDPILKAIIETPNSLAGALTKVSKDETLPIAIRLQALQAKHKLIILLRLHQEISDNQEQDTPLALQMLFFEDYYELGDLALAAGQLELAKTAFIQARSLLNTQENALLQAQQQSLDTKIVHILFRLSQSILDPWAKTLSYLETLHYANAEHPTSKALFDQALGSGIGGFSEKLSSVATQINPPDDAECRQRCAKGEVLLQTAFNGWWVLNQDAVKAFDNRQYIQKSTHRVAIIGDLHIKENPGCIGLAFAAWSLSRWMYFDAQNAAEDIGVIPVQPAKMMRFTRGQPMIDYVQLSPTVIGDNVQTLLSTDPNPQQLQNLESFHFSALVVLNLLLNMEDGRDANFVVRNGHLLSVDNDHAFVRDELGEQSVFGQTLEVKNLVFCMQAMQQDIDPKLREILTTMSFAPLSRIRAWLYSLRYYNQEVERLFGADVQALYDRPDDNAKVVLPAFFDANRLAQPCMKLVRIQQALKNSELRTHQDLFRKIQPKLSAIYEKSFTQPTLKQRMTQVGGLTGVSQTTHTQVIAKVTGQRIKDYLDFIKHQRGPNDLIAMLREIQKDKVMIDMIVTEISQGELSTFALEKDIQELVLSKLNNNHYGTQTYTPAAHQAFLQSISNELTTLTIKGNPRLTDDELMNLIKRMPKLKTVVLKDCEQLTSFTGFGIFRYDWLTELCKRGVKEIILNNCKTLSPQLLEVLPRLWDQYSSVNLEIINQPATWTGPTLTHVATTYPEKGLLIFPEWRSAEGQVQGFKVGHHISYVCALTVLHNGWLASCSNDTTIKLWDITGQKIKTLHGHSNTVWALTVLPNGWLASGSNDKTIKLWDITGQEIKTLRGHIDSVSTLAVLPNGWLASGSGNNTIKLWDVNTGQLIKTLHGHTRCWIDALTVLRNGWLASCGSGNNTITIWDIHTGQEIKTLCGHTSNVHSLAVLPNGWLASGSYDNTVKLWDVHTGQEIKTLHGHTNTVSALTALPNGWLASGSWDNTIKLWDVLTGQLIKTLHGHTYGVRALNVLQNGWLVSGSDDETIKAWPVYEDIFMTNLLQANKKIRILHNAKILLTRNQLRIDQVALLFPAQLTTLDVSYTPLTDKLLKAILEHCPKLKNINIDGCGLLTDTGKALLAERQTGLQRGGNTGKQALVSNTLNSWSLYYTMGAVTAITVGAAVAYRYYKHK